MITMGARAFILPRTGLRPLSFAGTCLVVLDDTAPPAWARIKTALYRAEDGAFVTEILCAPQATFAAPRPWWQAARAPGLAAAIAFYEQALPVVECACIPQPASAAAHTARAAARAGLEAAQVLAFRHHVGLFLQACCLTLAPP